FSGFHVTSLRRRIERVFFHQRLLGMNDHIREVAPLSATEVLLDKLCELRNLFHGQPLFSQTMIPREKHDPRHRSGATPPHIQSMWVARLLSLGCDRLRIAQGPKGYQPRIPLIAIVT